MSSSINRRHFLAGANGLAAAAVTGSVFGTGTALAASGGYTPDWTSTTPALRVCSPSETTPRPP
ncbi:hypothetical protein [Streptomyces paradoxus]|uniref:hypothetical protein n=1 Tax=Streptomyces paradoxus TaxID=66375 RepID=UPI00381D32FF